MKKIALVTATRAEYGILRPLIMKLEKDNDLELQLLVTGTHLEDKFGYTKNEIEKDGLPIYRCIPILEVGNTEYDISLTMANAIKKFAEWMWSDGWFEPKPAAAALWVGLSGVIRVGLSDSIFFNSEKRLSYS